MNNSKYKQSAQGSYYHLYNRANQKKEIFSQKDDYIFYLKRLAEACEKYEFSLVCYCLMPNHIHIIVKQKGEYSPSKLMSSLHTSYSMVFNKKYKLVGHLFQDRFKQKIISDDAYMKQLVAYIHLNPVKDNLCNFPKEYEWSSYREYANIKDSPLVCNQSLIESYGFKGHSFEEFIEFANQINAKDSFD